MDDHNSSEKKEKTICYKLFEMLYFVSSLQGVLLRFLGLREIASLEGPHIGQSLDPRVIVSKVSFSPIKPRTGCFNIIWNLVEYINTGFRTETLNQYF